MKKIIEENLEPVKVREDIYRTNSLPLASYLCTCKEISFVGINKEPSLAPHLSPTVFFLFKSFANARKFADKYFIGEATVNPMDLFKNYRALKDLVFETKRNPDV